MSQEQQAEKSFAFQLEVELFAQVKWDADGLTVFSKTPVCPRAGCDCTWDIANDAPKLNAKSLRCGLAHALGGAGIAATIPDTDIELPVRDRLTMWLVEHDDDHPTSPYEKMLLDEFHPVRVTSRIIDISEPNPSAEIEKVFNTIKAVCLIESGTDLDCSTRVRVFRTMHTPSTFTINPWDSFDLLNMGMACLMYGQAMLDMVPPAQRATPSAASIMARSIDNDTYDQMRDFMLGTNDGGQASWASVYNYLNKNIHHMEKTLSQATEWLVNFIASFQSTLPWGFQPLIAGDVAGLGAFEFRLPAGTVDPKWACHWVSFAIGFIISTDFEDYMGYSKHTWDTLDARLDKINGNHHMSLADLRDYIRQGWKVCRTCISDGHPVSERLQSMLLDPLMVYHSTHTMTSRQEVNLPARSLE